MSSVDKFLATLDKSAKPNRFECQIIPPQALKMSAQLPRDLNLRIESVSFPGRNMRTTTDENIYGPTYEVAQGITYGEEVSITFLLKNNHEERWFFTAWQDYIVSPTTYNVSYYNEYVSRMEVFQLDENDRKTAGIQIRDVFPKTVNAIEFSNTSTNDIIRATVGMSFREWVPLAVDPISGRYSPYEEYDEVVVTKRGTPRLFTKQSQNGFPISRPIGTSHVDSFPGREKGIFEDAGKAFNDVIAARDRVVGAQQKVLAFKNFFKGITKKPFGNLGVRF